MSKLWAATFTSLCFCTINNVIGFNHTNRFLDLEDVALLQNIVYSITGPRGRAVPTNVQPSSSTALEERVEGRDYGSYGGYGGHGQHHGHHQQQHYQCHCPYHYQNCDNNQLLYLGLGALLGFFLAMLLSSMTMTMATMGKRSLDDTQDEDYKQQTLGLYVLEALEKWPKELMVGEVGPGIKELYQVYKGTSAKPECARSIACQVGLLMKAPERSILRTAMMTIGSLAATAQVHDPQALVDNILTTMDIYSGGPGECTHTPDYCRLSNFI